MDEVKSINFYDSSPAGWEGKGKKGKWDEVVSAARKLDNGKCVIVEFKDALSPRRAQSALHTYVSKHQTPYSFSTSIKDNMLKIEKVN